MTVLDFAANTWAVVDAVGGGPVHLLGHHTGSMVAVEAASQRPDGVISVTSIGAPTYNRKLAEIEQPVLVVNPDDNCHTQSLRADALMKNGRRIDCPQWGHGFLNAFSADAAAAVLEFISETERHA